MYQPKDIAVYIHWPFCKSKCPYCDFYKELNRNVPEQELIDEYIRALDKYHDMLPQRCVKSIFFGGGTPSLLKAENVEKLVDFITKKWSCRDNIEISLEANPNSRYGTMFADLKQAGINRLSLGVQALQENDLRFLGRTHSLQQARASIEEVIRTFDNHSVDLIYARPHQTMENWLQELREVVHYGLKHISLYQLTIEEGTVFWRKGVQPLEENAALEMYVKTCEFLENSGYRQYEISNFAQAGFASIHNLTYWQGGDYIGIGKSAHGRLYLNGKHLASQYPFETEEITAQERAEELIIMGLRLTDGLNKDDFLKICGIPFQEFIHQQNFQDLITLGLLQENDTNVFATRRGLPLLNEIIRQLCA